MKVHLHSDLHSTQHTLCGEYLCVRVYANSCHYNFLKISKQPIDVCLAQCLARYDLALLADMAL